MARQSPPGYSRRCSPTCGFGCTQEAYELACHEAASLAARMAHETNLSWTTNIWENCGWCYSVERGCAVIFPQRKGSPITPHWEVTGYTCYVNTTPQAVISLNDPVRAFLLAMREAGNHFRAMQAALKDTLGDG